MKTLETHEISKAYGGRLVVDDVTVHVGQGEIVGLLGPNGAGKTTYFQIVMGLISPDSGRVTMDGQDITSMPTSQRARRGIGYLPREASVFRDLTVEENLQAVLENRPGSAHERRESLEQLLDRMDLNKVRRTQGYMLAGGDRRRTEIARSLAIHPSFLLLDEPFAGLEGSQVGELQRILSDLKRAGMGLLLTDHNLRETLAVTDRAYIMNHGRIFRHGSPEALGSNS
jgi:lipopolysaccharide export system ATP-binding protein